MAEDLKITLETKLNQAREDVKAIQGAGGLSGPSGAKALNKIQALFDDLSRKDLSKLDSEGLKQWLNDFSKLNHYIQSAGRGLSTYSAEYIKQQQKVEQANEALSKAQDKETEALKKQQEAIKKFGESKATFYNDKGRKVSNPETVAKLHEQNKLDIRDSTGKTSLTGAARSSVEKTITDMSAANKEVQVAQQEVKAAEVTLKAEKTTLEGMPSGGSTHPVTTRVDTHTAENYDIVKGAKEQINTAQSQQNQDLSESIGRNINALNKQSTSLGRAFKQFSIYAIALRTVKKALNEATKTIKDLDKYLTEQAMVTNKTRQQTYALLKEYQNMASDLGATTKEVAEVTTQFMRQGKTTRDALTLTRAAISAAKVAGISTAESVDYLTTAVNGFRLSANDAMRVSDKFAALAASAAVSYEEVATALSKVAAQANLAGMSIDYTTALLTKGIETTREPAESIGTALKTIVARMREITDYGKTLEDGMDINNVETQLAYVDIKLRDVNGELRSTEDVLNELGTKWDTLSQNQQAAVAKALAGTRQQSRLIAMMQDYDRVIELQQIAARSAGATSAQAAVYLEGMEAALNKVNVAWEKIVSAVTDSDVIISMINGVAGLLDRLGEFLDSTAGMIISLTTISIIGLSIVGNKMRELELARLQKKYTLEENKQQNLKNIALTKENIEKLKIAKQNAKARVDAAYERKLQLKKLSDIIQQRKAQGAIVTASEQYLQKEMVANAEEIKAAEAEYTQATNNLVLEEQRLTIMEKQQGILNSQSGLVASIGFGILGMITPITAIVGLIRMFGVGINAARIYQEKLNKTMDKTAAKEARNNALAGAGMFAKVVAAFAQLGPWGVVAGIALGAALAAAIGVAIAAATGNLPSQKKSGADKAADDVNKLSNEIYKLTEKANAIDSITKQYDALDNKIIKTNKDIKEMSELLDKAADKLDEEEKKAYNSLATNEQKRKYLENVSRNANSEANAKRKEQVSTIRGLSPKERAKLLNSETTNADYLETQSAIYALNNNTLYSYIDSLDKVEDGVESFTQSVLENMSAQEAWAYANDETGTGIKRLVDTINNATTSIDGEKTSYANILTSDDYSIRQKIDAYDKLHDEVSALGDPTLLKSFEEAYRQWDQFARTFSDSALNYIDNLGLSIDAINDFSAAIQKLGYTSEESAIKLNSLFSSLENEGNLADAIITTFDEVLGSLEKGTEDWTNAYNKILNGFQKATGVTLTNIGQNMTSLHSKISKFYETASKWSTLSESEKTEFMQENDALFRGESGAELARAFETGNYNVIQQALGNNEGLKESIRLELQELEIALQIAEAQKAAGEENEFEIKYLKEQIAALEDYQNAESDLYRADLQLRLEQEKSQLDLYKEYLEKQKDALTESLNKRKEAYEKYFDAINQEEEDAEYDKQAEILTANLSKLASSTNGAAKQQTKELEKQFAQLEEERLKTLRERAQEAVLSNLDNEVSEINNKFDELLEDQAKLLAAMNNEIATDPNGFVQNMLTSGIEGMTATQAEDYIKNNFSTAFDGVLPAGATDGIKVDTRDDGTLILNINGTEIPIGEAAQQDLYMVIMNALKQMGLK